MEDTPDFDAVIVVGVRPTPERHQRPIGLLAQGADLRGILVGISQDRAHFRRQECQQLRCDGMIRRIGSSQCGSQRNPHRAH